MDQVRLGEKPEFTLPSPIIPDLDLPSLLESSPSSPLDSPEGLKKLLSTPELSSYKGRGTKKLHRDVQAGIGLTASYLGTTKASRMSDVAITGAHSYERGYTSPNDLVNPLKSPKEELREKIIKGHGIIVNLAFDRLLSTLNLLDDDKLGKVQRASELSVIAKNLSGVISHASQATQDKLIDASEKSVHFHIMKPEQATDEDYPTLTINASSSPEFKKDSDLPS